MADVLATIGSRNKTSHGVASFSNLLFHGDNLQWIRDLLNSGYENSIDLIYIDPPFRTGQRYFRRIDSSFVSVFDDKWKQDGYLAMLRERLNSIRMLLSPTGSIFVHLDWHSVHHVKVMMDDIFGPENFRNEIIVKRGRRKNLQYQFDRIDRMHSAYDSILWYSKTRATKFPPPKAKVNSKSKWMGFWSNTERPTMRYEIFGTRPERGQWKWSRKRALRAIENYHCFESQKQFGSLDRYWEHNKRELEFIRKREGVKYPEYWIPPKEHKIIDNMWLDIEAYSYSTGYSTEKHPQLLERIISQFSLPGDLVADFFCGSGTTLVVAEKLRRKWIGCDSSGEAISVARSRLAKFQQHTLISIAAKPSWSVRNSKRSTKPFSNVFRTNLAALQRRPLPD